MEVWSQVAQDWQQDWPRRTARQIVILPANLTLSSERLRFLGKSHSACCPVSSLLLAWAYGWMTEWGKMGSSQLVRQREWEECGRRRGWDLVLSHLWFFLTSSNFPSMFTAHTQQPRESSSDTSLASDITECHYVSATLKSPQVSGSKTQKSFSIWQQDASVGKQGCLRKCLFFWFCSALISLDFRTN